MRLERNDEFAARVCGGWLGVQFAHPMIGLIALDEMNVPHAAIILNDYTGENIEITAVGVGGRSWRPSWVRAIARYVFKDLGCRRLTARTRVSNAKAQKALERAGFVREGIARDWFNDEDAILYGLLAKEQRIAR